MQNDSLFSPIVSLVTLTSRRRRFQYLVLLLLALISPASEIFNLGAAVPFIGILTQPEKVFNNSLFSGVKYYFGFSTPSELILPLAIAFASAALFAGILRILLIWANIHLSDAIGADLNAEAYRRTLFQPYSVHISRNSSEIISALDNEAEQAVMQAIEGLCNDLTLFIIAHCLTTLKNRDVIVKLDGGRITAQSTYDQIINNADGAQ